MPDPRPFPVSDEDSAAFWEGAKRRELVIKRCGDCGYWIHYPRPFCRMCHSENVKPTKVSGKGTVFTYSIARQQFQPGMPPPYVVALVELPEQKGLRLTANIHGCKPEQVYIGMPVEVTFEEREGGHVIPQFKPAPGAVR